MANYLPFVFMMGLGFMAFGVYIFTVNPNGPSDFPIGPLIAENNNTLIKQRTGIDYNLSADYAFGVVSIVAGAFFTGLPVFVYMVLPIYERFKKQ